MKKYILLSIVILSVVAISGCINIEGTRTVSMCNNSADVVFSWYNRPYENEGVDVSFIFHETSNYTVKISTIKGVLLYNDFIVVTSTPKTISYHIGSTGDFLIEVNSDSRIFKSE